MEIPWGEKYSEIDKQEKIIPNLRVQCVSKRTKPNFDAKKSNIDWSGDQVTR